MSNDLTRANQLFSGGTITNLTCDDKYSPYCPECDGCGEELCCSPVNCKMSKDGHYCGIYLRDLKIAYYCSQKLVEKMFEEMDKYEELREFDDKNYDEAYDKFTDTNN